MPSALIYVLDTARRDEYPALKGHLARLGVEAKAAAGARDVEVNADVEAADAAELAGRFDYLAVVGGYRMYYHVLGRRPPVKAWAAGFDEGALEALVREFHRAGRTIVAPYAVPAYLARLGLLKGREATVYPVTELVALLREGGATFVNRPAVRSGQFVTIKDVVRLSERELAGIRETT